MKTFIKSGSQLRPQSLHLRQGYWDTEFLGAAVSTVGRSPSPTHPVTSSPKKLN